MKSDCRLPFPTCRWSAALATLALTPALVAHMDDRKQKDDQPPFVGPAYRAALGGPLAAGGFAAEGVELRSWLPIGEFDAISYKAMDCWGYVSPSGREYAIVGLSDGTGFVEVTDPDDARILEVIPGPTNGWRDIKTFGHHAYIVSESSASGGVQVVDLDRIDAGIVLLVNTVGTGGTDKTHNVAIDTDSGYLYRAGGSGNGLRIYDLNADPVTPAFVGEWQDRYVHDVEIVTMTEGPFAGRQIAFTCGGFNSGHVETGLDVLDVTDKTNIIQISRYLYPEGAYSHQAWLSEDRQYLYLNDEFDEQDFGLPTTTHVIDVSDLRNPRQTGTFTNGSTAIDHNLYVKGSLIFEANYRSGLRVFDAADPETPVEIAYFDTYPDDDDANFNGLWSSYPFFPSGTIIGSDKERGLFVWTLAASTGDVNGDGVVDVADIIALLADWGDCPDPPEACPGDLDGNGVVDVADLLIVLSNWS